MGNDTIKVSEATNHTVAAGQSSIATRIEGDRHQLLAWLESHRAVSGGSTDEAHAELVGKVNRFYDGLSEVYRGFGNAVTKTTVNFQQKDTSLANRYTQMHVPNV